MKTSKRILAVRIKRMIDSDPDTSYLGDYSNRATSDYSIDRAHSLDCPNTDRESCDCIGDDWNRRKYRYFNPSDNYKGEPAEDIRKYVRQNYERMERLNAGDWYYIGILAEADIKTTRQGGLAGPTQTISSGGLWGIESDSDKSYIAEVESEQLAELKTELLALGFSRRAIATAFKNVEEVNE